MIRIVNYDHAKKKKKNTKLEPIPEPFYNNDKFIINNRGGRFYDFVVNNLFFSITVYVI